jgi:phi13 family phage major tail protein
MARQVGLKSVYVAELTEDSSTETTYDTPVFLENAISATISPTINTESWYSEDSMEEVSRTFDSITVEVETSQLSLSSRALLQGSSLVNGALLETSDDVAPTIALMFKSKKSTGAYRYVTLYKGSFDPTEDSYKTTENKKTGQTATIKGTFYARTSDNAYRLIMDDDEDDVDTTVIANWFTTVQEQPTE